jgi:hypothetical protein
MAKDICKKIGIFEKKQADDIAAIASTAAPEVEVTDDWISDIPVVGANKNNKGKSGKKK